MAMGGCSWIKNMCSKVLKTQRAHKGFMWWWIRMHKPSRMRRKPEWNYCSVMFVFACAFLIADGHRYWLINTFIFMCTRWKCDNNYSITAWKLQSAINRYLRIVIHIKFAHPKNHNDFKIPVFFFPNDFLFMRTNLLGERSFLWLHFMITILW